MLRRSSKFSSTVAIFSLLVLFIASDFDLFRKSSVPVEMNEASCVPNVLTYSRLQLKALKDHTFIPLSLLSRLRTLSICNPKYKATKRGSRGGKNKNELNSNTSTIMTHPSPQRASIYECNATKRHNMINVYYTNARSVCNKAHSFYEFIVSNDVDIMIITETWIASIDDIVIGQITPIGYSYRIANRTDRYGGGIIVIYKSDISFSKEIIQEHLSFENLKTNIELNNQQISLICIYRPSSDNRKRIFMNEFQDYIGDIVLKTERFLIIGDFNLHIDNALDSHAAQFLELLESLNLTQRIKEPTHEKGHTLDLVITRTNDTMIKSVNVEHDSFSDHSIIQIKLCYDKPSALKKVIKCRKLRGCNFNNLKDAIAQSKITESVNEQNTVEDKVTSFYKILSDILETFAPLTLKTLTIRPNKQWFNEELKTAKRVKRLAERKWRKTKLESHRESYRKAKYEANTIVTKCKSRYMQTKILENKGNPKQLASLIQGLVKHEQTKKTMPEHSDPKVLAESFSDFFNAKILNIRNSLEASDFQNENRNIQRSSDDNFPILANFSKATEHEIVSLVKSSPDKSCSLDTVPTWFIKKFIDILAPALTSIVNSSLESASMPPTLKHALVTPLIKKPSLDPDSLSNYRPVSNLNFVSKLIERFVAKQITAHLSENSLTPKLQSAYRQYHSTETALLKVQNDILCHIESGNCVALILLDLSAAFDTIDHSVLLSRLEHRFGIESGALEWISDYIKNRTQSIRLEPQPSVYPSSDGEIISAPSTITCGVPQGSILGPILFTLYTAPLCDLITSHNLEFHLYADDTQLYCPISRDSSASTLAAIENCCSEIKNWMTNNKLKLNEEKTEVLLLGTPHQRHQLQEITAEALHIGDSRIDILGSTSICNLGVVFDRDLTMKPQISKICQTVNFHLRNIYKIRVFLDQDCLKLIVQYLVMSRLDYANSLYVNLPSYNIEKLQKIQNKAARLITKSKCSDHITPVLKYLHWLPINQRIKFKVATLVFKCLNGLAPPYLTELIQKYVPNRSLRSEDKMLVTVPPHKLVKSERSFSIGAPLVWNELDRNVKSAPSLDIFKKRLKTFYFEEAFNN